MPKKPKRFKILLDEMLPRREKFPILNNLHNVRHVVHDFRLQGAIDSEVIKLAKSEKRILVTRNIKHFKDECRRLSVSLIGISESIQPEKLDKSITAVLRRNKLGLSGKYLKIVQ